MPMTAQPGNIGAVVTNLISQGFTPAAAVGAANYMYTNESGLDPNAVNPNSGAFGIGQWLGSRLASLQAQFGTAPTFDQQLQFLDSELPGQASGIATMTDQQAAYNAWGALFERPSPTDLAKAQAAYMPLDPSQYVASAAGGSGTSSPGGGIGPPAVPGLTAIGQALIANPVTGSVAQTVQGIGMLSGNPAAITAATAASPVISLSPALQSWLTSGALSVGIAILAIALILIAVWPAVRTEVVGQVRA
jgi:Phage tail lysozyme